MTNPVPQSELEDVLDAIRRLVAEERTQPRARAENAAARDKLVLTPALRVHEQPEDEPAAVPKALSVVADDSPEPGESTASREVADGMPIVPEDAGAAADESGLDAAAPAAPDVAVAGCDVANAGDSAAPIDPVASPADDNGDSEDDDRAEPAWDMPEPDTLTEHADTDASGDAPAGDSTPDGPTAPAAAERAATLESKIAELEAMVGMSGGWEPDEGDAPPFTAEGGPQAAFGPEMPEETGTPEADRMDVEETILDEDMLRDMVAEIVRQELQGELGERITRNVRKLVRREIHRALAAQLFD